MLLDPRRAAGGKEMKLAGKGCDRSGNRMIQDVDVAVTIWCQVRHAWSLVPCTQNTKEMCRRYLQIQAIAGLK